jgi:hypothetical protein
VLSLDDVDAAVTILTRFTADLRADVDLRP